MRNFKILYLRFVIDAELFEEVAERRERERMPSALWEELKNMSDYESTMKEYEERVNRIYEKAEWVMDNTAIPLAERMDIAYLSLEAFRFHVPKYCTDKHYSSHKRKVLKLLMKKLAYYAFPNDTKVQQRILKEQKIQKIEEINAEIEPLAAALSQVEKLAERLEDMGALSDAADIIRREIEKLNAEKKRV